MIPKFDVSNINNFDKTSQKNNIHLLVIGTVGKGKSTFLNSILENKSKENLFKFGRSSGGSVTREVSAKRF